MPNKRKWNGGKAKKEPNEKGHSRAHPYERRQSGTKGCQLIEVYGDLFETPEDHSLAHCVAADMRMGSGIAVDFRQKFKRVGELLDQEKGVGEVAVLKDKNRYIYYLVTKTRSTGKPTMDDLIKSLQQMKQHCEMKKVRNLAVPKLGCGLDQLDWNEVKRAIRKVFSDFEITITVCDFNPLMKHRNYYCKKSSVKVTYCNYVTAHTEDVSAHLMCGCKDGSIIDKNGKNTLSKFRLHKDFKRMDKTMGRIVKLNSRSGHNAIVLIVKETESDDFSYRNFEKCLVELRDTVNIDSCILNRFCNFMSMEKVITVIKHVFELTGMEFFICNPQNLEQRAFSQYTKKQGAKIEQESVVRHSRYRIRKSALKINSSF